MNHHNKINHPADQGAAGHDVVISDYSHQAWPRDFDFRQSRAEQQELLPPQQGNLPGISGQATFERH